jgi:hypothetical protein
MHGPPLGVVYLDRQFSCSPQGGHTAQAPGMLLNAQSPQSRRHKAVRYLVEQGQWPCDRYAVFQASVKLFGCDSQDRRHRDQDQRQETGYSHKAYPPLFASLFMCYCAPYLLVVGLCIVFSESGSCRSMCCVCYASWSCACAPCLSFLMFGPKGGGSLAESASAQWLPPVMPFCKGLGGSR